VRDGHDWNNPSFAHQGPKVMLINEHAGSGGDCFPYYFRETGLGKLVGTRTWGGLVGITGSPALVDGSGVTVPCFGIYELNGTWAIEGHGVDPDYQVVNDPASLAAGQDLQLDKAISVVLDELQANPGPQVVRPAFPDRSGAGIPESER
jgi:tricorn protease